MLQFVWKIPLLILVCAILGGMFCFIDKKNARDFLLSLIFLVLAVIFL